MTVFVEYDDNVNCFVAIPTRGPELILSSRGYAAAIQEAKFRIEYRWNTSEED
jgi:hypothetical protein